jgi:subtilase family serine protease
MSRMLLVMQRSPARETAIQQVPEEQQIKSSPAYHQWLTPEDFGNQFEPALEAVQAVATSLIRHGFQVN